MLPHETFSLAGAHAIVFLKQWLEQNDTELETWFKVRGRSDTFAIRSTEVTTVQWHHCLAREEKICFVLETAIANSTFVSTLNFMIAAGFLWKLLREGFQNSSSCTWHAYEVVLSDFNSNERHSETVIKEDLLFSEL